MEKILSCFSVRFAVFVIICLIFVNCQILKYPGDDCSIELKDNNLCVRNSACIQTGIYDDGDEKRQCMCSQGRILNPELHCEDCDDSKVGYACGENAACEYIEEIDANRCVCQGDFVRNFTLNDGSCSQCNEGLTSFVSLCDRGACKDAKCHCGYGYLKDPVNNTCVQCTEPWLSSIDCNVTYSNTSCFKNSETTDFVCMCPLGEAFNQEAVCGDCQEGEAECRLDWQCIEGHEYQDEDERRKLCYEECDIADESACDPRSTQKMCTVAGLYLGDDIHVCRCQPGYMQLSDGTCVSALQQLNCFSCNSTDSCARRQTPQENFFDTCHVGEYCWTTANWYWNFDGGRWENITYKRECHSNPCKDPDEHFCTDDPYHPGHHTCVTCCTTGLCNNRLLAPSISFSPNARFVHVTIIALPFVTALFKFFDI